MNLPSHRLAQTASAFAVLALLAIALTVGVAVAASDDRPGGGASPPAPPDPATPLGVLGLDGQPIVGVDGRPVQLPVADVPPLPDNPDETADPAVRPDAVTDTLTLLDAHRQTLEAVADHEQYGLVDRLDFFVRNAALAPAGGAASMSELRASLVAAERGAARGQTVDACTSLAAAAAGLDGEAPDLAGGLARPSLVDAVTRRQAALGC